MIDIVKVVSVKSAGGHRLSVCFSDGSQGIADLSWILETNGPMVEPLRDEALFAKVFVSNGVVTWPNGFDLDSIALHREMAEQGLLKQPAA
jgi:hypothetical protein